MTMMRLAALAIAVGQAAACFSPSFGDGQFTCEISNDCPPGIACIDGVCGGAAIPAIDAGQPGADGPIADPPDAGGPPPDAGPPAPARVYLHDFGDDYWVWVDAAVFFSGGNAPDYTELETGWAMCRGLNNLWCVGTPSAASCTSDGGDSWGSTDWGSLVVELGVTPPTFVTAWDEADGDLFKHAVFHSGSLWWELEYSSKPSIGLGFLFWTLYPFLDYDDPGQTDRDTEWALDPDAPPSAAAITADFVDDDDWILWTADGTEYRFHNGGWEPPTPSPYLALVDAPPADAVAAAFVCDGDLFVFTRGD